MNIPFVLCGKKGELFNNTFGMLQYLSNKPTVTFLVNVQVLTPNLDHKISLELRVKERLLLYPEELFFDSQGIPLKEY